MHTLALARALVARKDWICVMLSPHRLTVSISHPTASQCLVIAAGDVDIVTSELFASALQAGDDGPTTRVLTLDLTRVSFFAAAGLHPLVATHDRLHRRGAHLLVLPSTAVQLVLHAAGLSHRFSADRHDAPDRVADDSASPTSLGRPR